MILLEFLFCRMFLAVSVRLFMAKNATLLPNTSARRFTTLNSAVTWSPRSARIYQRKSATMSRRGSVRLWRKKSAKLFQKLNALKPPTDSVAASPSKSAPMFLSFSVSRYYGII